MAGSSFDVHSTVRSNYHYGRVWGNNDICAWIPPGSDRYGAGVVQ